MAIPLASVRYVLMFATLQPDTMRSLLLVVAAVDAAKDWRDAACLSGVVDEGATGRDVGIAAAAVDSIQCQSAETTRYSVEQIVDCAPHLQLNTSSALAYVLSAGLEEEAAYPAAARPEKCAYSAAKATKKIACLLYTSPSPRDATLSRMPSSA